jgi:DNA invertase Pin-like site-specific DNA recombinase
MRDAWNKGRGRHQVFKGSTNPFAKINEETAIRIRVLRNEGKTYADIASEVGSTISVVGKVCRNERWNHVTAPHEVH